jgi:hypothetical protein
MALDLLPYSNWAAGTLQNSVPANTNALRSEVLVAHVISDTVTAQPGTPADGDCYIIPTGRTGTAWATFAVGSLAYFRGGTWYEFTAYEGLLKVVGAALKLYTGSAWAVYGGGGGGGLSNPMTTAGDIITGGASGTPQRLPVGPNGHVLTAASGAPVWAPGGSGDWLESVQEMRGFNNTSSWNVFGQQAPTATGSPRAQLIEATNAATARPRVGADVTPATATAVAGWRVGTRQCYVGSGTSGGFVFSGGFVIYDGATNSSHRAFLGLFAAGTAPTDVNPSTIVDMLGVGYDAADTNVQFFHNDASGTASKIDTGIAKPTTNNSRGYLVNIDCPPGGPVTFSIREVVTGATFTATASTNLPAATTFLGGLGYASVGGVSSVIGIAFYRQMVKTRSL